VCFDFLRSEWNGTYKHSSANNAYEAIPNVNGVDDYLHQAADKANWPVGIVYDPDNSGKPIGSLGVHEHWNNPENKQYSGNLGKSGGIELISIPDTLIKGGKIAAIQTNDKAPDNQNVTKPENQQLKPVDSSAPVFTTSKPDEGIQLKGVKSVTIDMDNTKWFVTESGIVSFDGRKWTIHNKNRKVTSDSLRGVAYDFSSYGHELWIATPKGATVATIPVDARTGATTYYPENSSILSEDVVALAVGKGSLRWFGTEKGISGFRNKKWLKPAYQRKYPDGMFKDFPITAMATSIDGDSLYVATEGAGVARLYRDKVDAITGASEYAQWGPIEIPSDKVYSIYIAPDGTQWFGTDMGVARHEGYKTLDRWTVFNKENGLIDNFVQAIGGDSKGRIWFGTKKGISVLDGKVWNSYTKKEGLTDDNILCIVSDKDGVIWIGTSASVISFTNNEFTVYR
jgi:ligand-binding sensor domain-containing protein